VLVAALGVGTGAAATASAAKRSPGTLTTTVSALHGKRTTSLSSGPVITVDQARRPLVATTSGKVLVVARYTKKGKLDKKFAKHGIARITVRKDLSVSDITVDARGRLVVVGGSQANAGARSKLVLLRLTKKGKLDKKFAEHGIAMLKHASATAVAIDAAGRLVVTGRSTKPSAALVSRWDARGRLDAGFGTRGISRLSVYGSQENAYIGTGAGESLIDATGRIVVQLGVFRGIGQPSETGVARFTAGGALDTSFGENGAGGYTSGTLGLQVGGAIGTGIAALGGGGYAVTGTAHGQYFLQRYDAEGMTDGDPVLTDLTKGFLEGGNAMAADPQGRVISVGDSHPRIGVLRYRSDGSLDTGFGHGGALRPKNAPGTQSMTATDVTVDRAGRVLVAGVATPKKGYTDRVFVMRLKKNGKPDKSWRTRG